MKCGVGPAWGALSDLLFPRECVVCGGKLDVGEDSICGTCLLDVPYTRFWDWDENPAERRIWRYAGIESAASLFFYRYEGGYASLVHQVKYGGRPELGHRLGLSLGRKMAASGRFCSIQAVVPVPLHPLRRLRRGYNQAEKIASGIAEGLGGLPVVTVLLRRSRNTHTQTQLSGEEKRRNVAGAFEADLESARLLASRGIRNILVADDVMTSGATISAAVHPLMEAFRVSVATIGFVE